MDKITVPNIIEICGYSKTTFYRLFKDKYDLMAWDYAQRLQAIVGQTEKEDYEWKQMRCVNSCILPLISMAIPQKTTASAV